MAADLVLVLDISSSMGFLTEILDRELDGIVEEANRAGRSTRFGLIPFVDNYRIDMTGNLASGRVHTTSHGLRRAVQYYRRNYTGTNRNPGDGISGPAKQNPLCEENALDALHAAAEEFPWRSYAGRIVVVATDDTFLENPDNYGDRDSDGDTSSKDFPTEGNYPARRTLSETVRALRDRNARVFSITRLAPPAASDKTAPRCAGDRRLSRSAVSDGWSTPYKGQPPIPEQLGGRNYDLDEVRKGNLSLSRTLLDVVAAGGVCALAGD